MRMLLWAAREERGISASMGVIDTVFQNKNSIMLLKNDFYVGGSSGALVKVADGGRTSSGLL